jgi:2-polyprenyl-3-methyl-5-hydroxy-6-metoxy-1,4-benzoquinol methylase
LHAFEKTAVNLHNPSWLDLGCHQGQFVKLLQEKYGAMATGVDNWGPGLKSDDSWRYVQADIEAGIPLDDTFDVVSALEVIEHMIDTDAFLQRCNRLVKTGGHLIS